MDAERRPTRSWERKQRRGWWLRYLGAVAATVAALQGVGQAVSWSRRMAGVQTVEDAAIQHANMRAEMAEQLDKLGERIEQSVDRLGSRIDNLATRRRK